MAEYGAKVVIAGRNLERAEDVAQNIISKFNNSEATAMQVDITDEKSVAALRDKVVSHFGTVDILVNSHGVNIKRNATEFPVNDWDHLFEVNVRGTMLSCREFGKVMIERKKGKVINISSVRGMTSYRLGRQ